MPIRYYANAPATALASGVTSGATSLTVNSVAGFPSSFPYTLIIDRNLSTEEAVSITAGTGTNLTATRGIDGTSAFAHSAGAVVVHGITAQDIREANTHVNATSDVHGVTGALVGATSTQTLTNKNMTSGTNLFPNAITPVGAGLEWYTATPPTGWLLQDGAAVSRTTYAALFAVIGTLYGAGDGTTTFNLPNRKGRVGVGLDAASGNIFDNLGEAGGEKTHVLDVSEIPSHTHIQNAHDHGAVISPGVPALGASTFEGRAIAGAGSQFELAGTLTNIDIETTIATNQNTGGGAALSLVQPYIVVNFIIKV